VFALDLMSTYEGEHTIFGLLDQANLTQNDVLQFHGEVYLLRTYVIKLSMTYGFCSPALFEGTD
jgi:hypothetical protein